MMHTEEEYIKLEEEELEITNESILTMVLILSSVEDNLEKELRGFYQKYGKDGVVTYAEARKWISERDHQRRLTALLLLVNGAFVGALADMETHFRSFLTKVIGKESTFFGVEVDVEKILTRKWGADDLYWLQRLEKDVELWNYRIIGDIRRAMLQRMTLDELLSVVDGRFASIMSVLKTLGLSESSAVGSISRHAIFKELGVSKYQFFTNPDERRCETCGDLHGLIFPMSAYEVGVTASPIHPRCRCWEIPIWD